MDQEQHLPPGTPKPLRVLIRVKDSGLPGVGGCVGQVVHAPTLSVEDLAARAVSRGSVFTKAELTLAFRTMADELYRAVEEGNNVDFLFGRTTLGVLGRFGSPLDPFDAKRHTISASLQPAPRLKQTAARIPAENINQTNSPFAPHPAAVSASSDPNDYDAERFNQLYEGEATFLFIHGKYLMLMGEDPSVGIRVRCLDTGESYEVRREELIFNSATRLGFLPKRPLTAGTWEITITTQYSRSYTPVKHPRTGGLTFTVLPVSDDTP